MLTEKLRLRTTEGPAHSLAALSALQPPALKGQGRAAALVETRVGSCSGLRKRRHRKTCIRVMRLMAAHSFRQLSQPSEPGSRAAADLLAPEKDTLCAITLSRVAAVEARLCAVHGLK